MHSIQFESHIDKQSYLKLQLPNEWVNQDVNIVVLEKKAEPIKPQNLSVAFELLATMPENFMQT
ncbi:hypothetical protein [Candidatus Albibeggiatoa sp. nov. BB20]|uniref:hypothetical protein n=1 Tax=Candidatus Albibeggiatoa sp. nov. BB20 TaxID=3162723 RepID=UPI0033654111